MHFYSPSSGGFYDKDIHGANIPADAIGVTAEQRITLVEGANAGMRIAVISGAPSLVDAPPPSPEVLAAEARAQRARLMHESDWTALGDNALDANARVAWANYRKALRDVPQQPSFPLSISWPTAPGE